MVTKNFTWAKDWNSGEPAPVPEEPENQATQEPGSIPRGITPEGQPAANPVDHPCEGCDMSGDCGFTEQDGLWICRTGKVKHDTDPSAPREFAEGEVVNTRTWGQATVESVTEKTVVITFVVTDPDDPTKTSEGTKRVNKERLRVDLVPDDQKGG